MPWLTEIDISKKWWENNKSPLMRFELVLHEIGHCVLHRSHTERNYTSNGITKWFEDMLFSLNVIKEKDRLYDSCPASIMHPYTINEHCFKKHYLYYTEELFSKIPYNKFAEKYSFQIYFGNNCKIPKIINETNEWNDEDQSTFNRSKKRCLKLYNTCLKTFIKKGKSMGFYSFPVARFMEIRFPNSSLPKKIIEEMLQLWDPELVMMKPKDSQKP